MSTTTAPPATTPIPVQLSESEFDTFILPHLSMPKRGPKCKLGYHRVFNLILWVLYTGMQWKCLPIPTGTQGKPAIHYPFYVAAIVKPVCALFRLFLSLPLLSNDDWTQTRTYCRPAHTDNVDRWIGYAPHSPCGCLRLLGLAPSSLLGSTCIVCCWLRDAWGLLAPNDLLSVSAARPPSTQSPMRFEALREAQW